MLGKPSLACRTHRPRGCPRVRPRGEDVQCFSAGGFRPPQLAELYGVTGSTVTTASLTLKTDVEPALPSSRWQRTVTATGTLKLWATMNDAAAAPEVPPVPLGTEIAVMSESRTVLLASIV